MKAVVLRETGGVDKLLWETIPVPEPTAGQVLVHVKAIGLNFIDTYHRTGLYKLPLPAILGREAAGQVAALGAGCSRFSIGDRVVFLAGSSGTYAEQVLVDESKLVAIPEGVSFEAAAALSIQGMTAHYLACSTYPIQRGDTVLVHAGAGGTGRLLIQIAKLRGAQVITTVGSKVKESVARSAGADHVILYNEQDFAEEVAKITGGEGVHAVYDSVGKTTFEKSMKCLRRRGYLVMFGNASGVPPVFDPMELRFKSLFLTRAALHDYIVTDEERLWRMNDILQWVAEKKLDILIGKTFPLEQVADAHRYIESRESVGKIILLT